MTENEIKLLGFEIHHDDGDGFWNKYHYYTYTVARGFEFITNASDDLEDSNQWYVEFFESDPEIRFYNFEEVQNLINLLEKRKVKNQI